MTAADCWAVGFSGDGVSPLIEHYTGSRWAISTPNSSAGQLNGVTCESDGNCWAVGSSSGYPLIEHYTGSIWAVISSPIPSPGQLNGVTCVSAGDCWAVGISGTQPLVEHYTGSSWASVSTLHPSPGQLNGVTCASAGDCWAVGSLGIWGNGSSTQALIEHYAGSRWAIVSTPRPSSGLFGGLKGVTCVSAGDCWAVGSLPATGPSPPLIEHYTGSNWAVVSTSNPVSGQLFGVTCASAGDCWAVGSTHHITPGQLLIEDQTASSWAIVTANPDDEGNLNGVTCVSAGDCWAVGYYGGGPPSSEALIEHYVRGSWAGSIWAS